MVGLGSRCSCVKGETERWGWDEVMSEIVFRL